MQQDYFINKRMFNNLNRNSNLKNGTRIALKLKNAAQQNMR